MKKRKLFSALTAVMALCMAVAPSAWAEEEKSEPDVTEAVTAEPMLKNEEGVVQINDTNFPDSGFKNYISLVIDKDGDSWLSQSEIDSVKKITFSSSPYLRYVESLKGIEYFTELTYLDFSKSRILRLDVSNNTTLETLKCNDMISQFWSLDVSGCTALTYLNCHANALENLNVSGCTALTYLDCGNNKLTSLDVSGCTALTYLDCGTNNITNLDLSKNIALEELYCYSNKLTSFDVSKHTSLKKLRFGSYSCKTLDVSGCTNLTNLDCSYNYGSLTSINASGCALLSSLKFDGNSLEELNLSGCAITELDFSKNQLTSLDVSGCTALKKLLCYSNQLTSLDVSGCTALTEIDCNNNQLTSLDVSGCTALTKISCYDNALENLNVSGCTALTYLSCNGNPLNSIDASGCIQLKSIYFDSNLPKSLNISGCTSFVEADFSKNQLTSLDVSGCTALKKLLCNNNHLTSLNVSGCTALEHLNCSTNDLSVLDVSTCSSLKELLCGIANFSSSSNNLTKLDVSKNTYLEHLDCCGNNLTSLDVSKNTYLNYLDCSANKLTSLNVSNNSRLNYLYCTDNFYDINIVNGEYKLSSLPAGFDIAKASNWDGGTYDSTSNSLKNIDGRIVYYDYDCGNGYTCMFELNVKESVEIDYVADFVERLYVNLMGRASDPKGKADHVSRLKAGQSACDVAKGFVLSPELKNKKLSNEEFVTRMYVTMLNRKPDAAGLAKWTKVLDSGCSYGAILQGFCGASEFTQLCADYGVTRGTYKSPEYRDYNANLTAYVSRMYTVAMGRNYDVGGLNNHTRNYLNGTKTAEGIAHDFIFSPEFKQKNLSDEEFVECMYNTLFGRKSDAAGKNKWLAQMKNGVDREGVFKGFTGAQEFKNMVAGFGI